LVVRQDQWFSSLRELAGWVANLMRPGIGLKRWLALAIVGTLTIATGMTIASNVSLLETLRTLGRLSTFGGTVSDIVRGGAISVAGLGLVLVAMFMLFRRVSFGARYGQGHVGVIASLVRQQARRGGRRIVVVGGGTGQSIVLRGLRDITDDITAIITVADDGGSSGRLRSELGIAPPGDARQCLIALSDSGPLLERVFDYRFESGDSLKGHSLGNLLLASLVDIEGSFPKALTAAGELLVVHGRVVPSTFSSNVRLMAKLESGEVVNGESAIGATSQPIQGIWIEPQNAEVNPDAVAAIAEAELIIIGPGSLYTSLLPNLLVPGLADALRASLAPKVYVCNVAEQPGETDDMSEVDHLQTLEWLSGVPMTHFLVNDHLGAIKQQPQGRMDKSWRDEIRADLRVIEADVMDSLKSTQHDPAKLARVLLEVKISPDD
jgi:uncharacterized cofD-like protein